jgi:cytochrome c peroxidase
MRFIYLILFVLFCFAFNIHKTAYTFQLSPFFPEMPVDSNNRVTKEGAKLGRYLFYDSILSKNYNMSCASCH